MPEATGNVFVYGSLLQGLGNHSVMQSTFGETMYRMMRGVIRPDQELVLCQWKTHTSFPFVAPAGSLPAGNIHGEVYFNVPHMRHLDALEGYPNFYNRAQFQVDCDGEEVPAWVYFIEHEHPDSYVAVQGGDWRNVR